MSYPYVILLVLKVEKESLLKGELNMLNNYYNEIRSDIAKEFGFEAIGYGSVKLDKLNAKDYLAKWNSLSTDEQNELLKKRGY
jgi:hypothetical protein